MALSKKQRLFVEEYLQTWNATEAARRAGYKGNDVTLASVGYENLRKPQIEEAIRLRLQESAMSADEVLMRLADQARADLGPYMSDDGEIDIAAMKADGKTHLIHTVERFVQSGVNQDGGEWENVRTKIKTYNAFEARQLLAKHHGLLKETVEHTGEVTTLIKMDR